MRLPRDGARKYLIHPCRVERRQGLDGITGSGSFMRSPNFRLAPALLSSGEKETYGSFYFMLSSEGSFLAPPCTASRSSSVSSCCSSASSDCSSSFSSSALMGIPFFACCVHVCINTIVLQRLQSLSTRPRYEISR